MTRRFTREEFRLWAEGQTQRYERLAGEPIAMSQNLSSTFASKRVSGVPWTVRFRAPVWIARRSLTV
jgi:hypothetical protein